MTDSEQIDALEKLLFEHHELDIYTSSNYVRIEENGELIGKGVTLREAIDNALDNQK